MPWSLFEIPLALPAYALVLFRLTGLMITAPIYSSALIPGRVKGAMVMVIAAMIFPLVRGQAPADLTLGTAIAGGVGELMIGAIIGLTLTVMLSGAEVAGLIVGRQAGLAIANVFDPTLNQQVSVTGQVYAITMTFVFLIAGGHRATMAALLDTFEVVPLLSFRLDETFVVMLVQTLSAAFIMGIRIAGPVLIALFLLGTGLAFLSRTMPQLNILTVGFTLRAMFAIGIAGTSLVMCQDVFLDAIWSAIEAVRMSYGLDPMSWHMRY